MQIYVYRAYIFIIFEEYSFNIYYPFGVFLTSLPKHHQLFHTNEITSLSNRLIMKMLDKPAFQKFIIEQC